ncbi:MAG: invasin domain 3-containing protein [Chloroflexota bacterium]|nr:invasin domain 3-containing protein [Chloroflexota bacterium]
MIDTANQTSGDWFAGDSTDRKTMERKDPTASGADGSNWATNDPSVARNGLDAGENPINGTPKADNSVTTVLGPPYSPSTVTVTVDSSTISCCVTTTVRVTVTDEYRNAVTDTTPVTLTTDLTAEISPLTDTTESGLVTATVHGDKVGHGTITATTTEDISGTTSLTVTHSTPCTLTLTASPKAIVANGVDSATITAAVMDVCSNPVPSTTVFFTTSLGSIGSLTTTRTTDVNGKAAAALTGAVAGTAIITATADSASGTTTVNFTALPVPVGGVTYAAEGSLVPRIGVAALAVPVLFRAALLLSRHRSWPSGWGAGGSKKGKERPL